MSTGPNIIIVDYGVGNLGNAEKGFARFASKTAISGKSADIRRADALVLPGVGSFQAGMEGLRERNLIDDVKTFAASGKSVMGICLGAQLMLSAGHEFGTFAGLGIMQGQVIPFPALARDTVIPHIGWSKIRPPSEGAWQGTPFANSVPNDAMYFVHSFNLAPDEPENVLALATYGGHEFCAAIHKGNVYGCQFHPERSGRAGLSIIEQFVASI